MLSFAARLQAGSSDDLTILLPPGRNEWLDDPPAGAEDADNDRTGKISRMSRSLLKRSDFSHPLSECCSVGVCHHIHSMRYQASTREAKLCERNRQNSHIFAVVLDEGIAEARAVRGASGKIFSEFRQEQSASPTAAIVQASHWDRSFLRAKRPGHGSGNAALLMVGVVVLRFMVPMMWPYQRVVAGDESGF
jgi:hypothetical protein